MYLIYHKCVCTIDMHLCNKKLQIRITLNLCTKCCCKYFQMRLSVASYSQAVPFGCRQHHIAEVVQVCLGSILMAVFNEINCILTRLVHLGYDGVGQIPENSPTWRSASHIMGKECCDNRYIYSNTSSKYVECARKMANYLYQFYTQLVS